MKRLLAAAALAAALGGVSGTVAIAARTCSSRIPCSRRRSIMRVRVRCEVMPKPVKLRVMVSTIREPSRVEHCGSGQSARE